MRQFLLIFFLLITLFANSQNKNSEFDKILHRYETEQGFSGTVLVAKKGKVVYSKSVGIASKQLFSPINDHSKFKICSITKTFTSVLILKMVEAGKIDLNETIGKYLPEYQGEGKNAIKMDHLLTYSSGLDNIDQRENAMYLSKMPVHTIITKYGSGKLVSEPGVQFSYKNIDFIILGKIIEELSGKSFEETLSDSILKPLGMNESGYLTNDKIVPGLVTSYLKDSLGNYSNDDFYWIDNFYSSAAMYATNTDLLKFDQAIFNGKILKKETVSMMLRPHENLYGVAYGFWVSKTKIGKSMVTVADRRGSISGSNSIWYHLMEPGITIFILSNNNAFDLVELRDQLANHSVFQ